MNKKELEKYWMSEENAANIHGWDFSHINERYEEEKDLPWNYYNIIREYLEPENKILDIDTGGGEFFLSLNHPFRNMSATESYPPNVNLCKEMLLPLGIDFKEADAKGILPFEDGTFDIIINRHGDYNVKELNRVLKPGGVFITEQVGAENDRELIELILPKVPEIPFPEQYLKIGLHKLKQNGFSIVDGKEAFRPIKFWDVGALVWFAHIIQWEFPNFTVKDSLDKLYYAQELLEKENCIQGKIHRYLIIARKKLG